MSMPTYLSPVTSGGAVAEALSLLRDVVNQDVLAEALGRCVEDAALVHARDLVHELLEVVVAVEHERVDDDALLSAAADLFQRLADGDRARRRGGVGGAVREVRRRFGVRCDDDL